LLNNQGFIKIDGRNISVVLRDKAFTVLLNLIALKKTVRSIDKSDIREKRLTHPLISASIRFVTFPARFSRQARKLLNGRKRSIRIYEKTLFIRGLPGAAGFDKRRARSIKRKAIGKSPRCNTREGDRRRPPDKAEKF
jgi:hypothetical protein